jgi:hypothetical protein
MRRIVDLACALQDDAKEEGPQWVALTDALPGKDGVGVSGGAPSTQRLETPLSLTKKSLTPCSRQALVLQRLTLRSGRTPETNCSVVKRPSPCLVFSPFPCPPKVINTCMWLWCEEAVGCTRCCAMSAALAPSSCNQGCGRCAHQPSERAHASSPCLNINHEPLAKIKKCSGGAV